MILVTMTRSEAMAVLEWMRGRTPNGGNVNYVELRNRVLAALHAESVRTKTVVMEEQGDGKGR